MSEAETQEAVPPLVPYLEPNAGKPYIAGSRCEACGHVFVGERQVCAKCTARGKMKPVHIAETGKLYAFTIVERSFPGVQVPFVDVVVDMDDGAHLKGTLLDVEPNPEKIPFDLPVKLVYREAVPINTKGKPYLTYYFVPA
ncbi:MAG: OB-fold domain-containing protein [Alphaproteobacteria bacterium]|nr:OB-fold domain-containing protein [Alphaproteobacteria bacterium]